MVECHLDMCDGMIGTTQRKIPATASMFACTHGTDVCPAGETPGTFPGTLGGRPRALFAGSTEDFPPAEDSEATSSPWASATFRASTSTSTSAKRLPPSQKVPWTGPHHQPHVSLAGHLRFH